MSLIFLLFPSRYSVSYGIPEYHHDNLPFKSVQNHLSIAAVSRGTIRLRQNDDSRIENCLYVAESVIF